MSVFDTATKIKLAVGNPKTDHKVPHPRSLSLNQITMATALVGTKGQHCNIVHGDQWQELNGSEMHHIARNQTIRVRGKHKETIVESCYQNIIGPHIVQNNNVRNETRLDRFNLVYGDNELTSSKIGDVSAMGVAASAVLFTDFEFAGIKVEFTPLHAEFKLWHETYTIMEQQTATTNVEMYTTCVQSAIISIQAAGTSVDLKTISVDQNNLAQTYFTAASRAWIGVAQANAGMTVGPTPPLVPH